MALCAVACGGRTIGPNGEPDTTSASPSSEGAATNPDASDFSADAAVNPTDAAVNPTDAAVNPADAAVNPADAAVKRRCALTDPTDRVVGSVSGRPIDTVFGTLFKGQFPVLNSSWSALFENSAERVVIGWGEGDRHGGVQTNAGGLIVLPDEGQPGSTFYCASQVEAYLTTGDADWAAAVTLSNLSELGRCPGAPVSGEVDVCIASDSPPGVGPDSCPSRFFDVSGTIEGTALALRSPAGTVSGRANDAHAPLHLFGGYDDDGAILFDRQPDGSITGWLRIANGNAANAGTVYCLGGARLKNLSGSDYRVSFQELGTLGVCPGAPVAGEVGFCF